MNRAAATSNISPSALPILLLLLSYCISGGEGYRVVAPSKYKALQGQLTATVYLRATSSPSTDAPLYTWDFDNSVPYILNSSLDSPDGDSSSGELEADDPESAEDGPVEPPSFQPLPVVDTRWDSDYPEYPEEEEKETDSPPETPLTLSLFANGSSEPIKSYRVNESEDWSTLIFPCGVVVQGGTHFLRLERGEEVLALSNNIEVEWPEITLEVPSQVETYRTYVKVTLSFVRNVCRPSSNIDFIAWVDLLYHGVPVGMVDASSAPTQINAASPVSDQDAKTMWNRSLWNSLQEDRNKRALRRFRRIFRGKRKYKKNKRGKKVKNNRNGKRKNRKRGKGVIDVDVSKDNRTEGVDTSLKDTVNNSTKAVYDSDIGTNNTNVDVLVKPYVNRTRGNERPGMGKRTSKRRKEVLSGSGNRTSPGEEDSDGTSPATGERRGKRPFSRKKVNRINRRKGMKRRMRKMKTKEQGNGDIREGLTRDSTLYTVTEFPEFSFSSSSVIEEQIAGETGTEQNQNESGMEVECDFPGTKENVSKSSVDEEEEETSSEIPAPRENIPVLEDPVPDSHEQFTVSHKQIPVLEDEMPGDQDQIQGQKEQIPDYGKIPSESSERFPDPEDHGSLSQDQFPDRIEQTTAFPENSPVSEGQRKIPSTKEGYPYFRRQPLQKSKRAIMSDRSHDAKHPPQATIVSSGSRGGAWAWGGDAVIHGTVYLGESLYSHLGDEIRFNCSTIGPAGLYSVRLATNVSTKPVITSSQWFTVIWSEQFSLYVHAAHIKPCSGPIGVHLAYPSCIGVNDKVRVYARIRADVSSVNSPIINKYVGERRVIKGMTTVKFPCPTFYEEATEFCFVYINTALNKAVSAVVKQCIPAYKLNAIRQNGGWGQWSEWTPCTSTCGPGQRIRHRFCDSPQPRNGGDFCKGDTVEALPCEAKECEEPSRYPPPASTPGEERCDCGCTLELPTGVSTIISSSAAECAGTAVWLLQAPKGEHVVAEVVRASLHPGSQWLKLRDGDSVTSPLLVRLPASPVQSTDSSPTPRRLPNSPRRSSSGNKLFLEFRSDVNVSSATINPALYGFLVSVFPSAETLVAKSSNKDPGEKNTTYWGLLAGMHIAAVVFISALVAAVIVLAVYNWRRYRLYKRARLIPESPYMTPPSTPCREVVAGSSMLTLTEVISLKSLVMRPKLPVSLPLKRKGSAASYSALDNQHHEDPRHSLPNSPFLTRRALTPSTIRRSTSQIGRFLRKGSGNFKKKKRRFASVDELETRCISPIHETHKEEEGEASKDGTAENMNQRGEEDSAKYKEYRKSLLAHEMKDLRLPHKLVKDKLNLERIKRSEISRSNSNATMRAASSASELSVNGTDTEMEYDYYDYDMDNASAVPGSLFGLDPLILAWVPPFIPLSGGVTPPDEGIPLDVIVNSSSNDADAEAATPTAEQPSRPKVLALEHLNIPHIEADIKNSMETSMQSEEANDRVELKANGSVCKASPEYDDDDPTPTTEIGSKILNLDDFQFADDTDEDEDIEL